MLTGRYGISFYERTYWASSLRTQRPITTGICWSGSRLRNFCSRELSKINFA
jgi:hypothetical protein